MAVLASTKVTEITGIPGVEVVYGTVTTTGDTYVSRFREITSVQISDQTTTGGANCTYSGGTVTITATNGDVVDLLIFGKD